MMKNSLPNNRNPKSERETNAAVLKTLFPSIDLEGELCSSIFFIVIIIWCRQTNVAS